MAHQNIEKLERQLADSSLTVLDVKQLRDWGKGYSFKGLPEDEKKHFLELLAQAEKLEKEGNLPTKPISLQPPPPTTHGANSRYRPASNARDQGSQTASSNASAAPASVIGEPFTNPYSFIPFPNKAPERNAPTPRTADEMDKNRFTGILCLKVKTLSPLMTSEAENYNEKADHKKYHALTIGSDVIVPASGIRGSLRTLMTIISGATLGYMDDTLYLCQGRDAQLGPAGKTSEPNVPKNVFLAKIIKPGSATTSGTVQLGTTNLVKWEELNNKGFRKEQRPSNGKIPSLPLYGGQEVKLSGHPINSKGKSEGLFNPDDAVIELPSELWNAYQGRNRHGEFSELRKGWLIWLEPENPDASKICSAADVKSIQWARWGRHGQPIEKALPPHIRPDSLQGDGKVDMVTDLFGQVPFKPDIDAPIFSGRIRPSNLVFKNAKSKTCPVTLAPLCAPHPGCVAFYRANTNLDQISQEDSLRGYKVYRTTKERGDKDAPWYYDQQPVFDKTNPKLPEQKVNSTRDLLNENIEGELELALHGLSPIELSLLLHICAVDWRLGGGKPFGLGHCKVEIAGLVNEFGEDVDATARTAPLPDSIQKRLELYKKSQIPVDKLRYPRAIKPAKDSSRNTKAGHVWFSRHAALKKNATTGLATIWTDGHLQESAGGKEQIKAQPLPLLDSAPEDFLYGYDCSADEDIQKNNKTIVSNLAKEIPGTSPRGGGDGHNTSPSRESRQNFRQDR